MSLVNLLLAFSSLTALILGVLVLASNPRRLNNRTLAFFVLSIFLWLATNLLTNISSSMELSLFFARLTLVGGALIPFSFIVFIKSYLDNSLKILNLLIWFVPVFVLLCFTPTSYNIVSIEAYGENTKTGSIYILLVTNLIIYFSYGLVRLYMKYKSRSIDVVQLQQIKYIFIGVISAFVPALIINGVLPLVTDNDKVILYGPNAAVVLAAFTAFAIVRHKFLNIRLVVARSMAYVLSILILSAFYGFVAFNIINRLAFGGETINANRRLVFTALAVIMAFTFQPLKRFFDKLTNQVFYQDAYDSQDLLDSLNKVLLSTTDLNVLLSKSAEVINNTLRTQYVLFGIKKMGKTQQRIIGTAEKHFDPDDIEQVRKLTPEMNTKVIITDTLDDQSAKVQALLQKNDVALLAHLTDTLNKKAEGIGYIVIGEKKSGTPFSSQDTKVMEIIADDMVIAIQNALRFEEIQNFASTLQQKVDDATKQLRKTNQRLKELDQTKDDFISMASHQLRTPLTSIKGYVSMVMEGDAGKITKQQSKLLDQAFVSSQRMVYLIADLLNVSRLRTGKFVIEPKMTNLADVIDGEMAQLTGTAEGRGLELVYEKPRNFPDLMLDETKIRQVIMNFADNAVHYTPRGGHIKVELKDLGDSIEFTVTDDGIGVPKSEQHHLFNKFYRAGNAKKARPDGTGLGLFMAKKVVIAQGGSIIFKTQEGKGSTFGFSFAKKALQPAASEIAAAAS